MVEAVGCPRCHRPVPADAPSGECPACLLLLGLADTPDDGREGTVAVTVAAAAVEASGSATAVLDATLTAGGVSADEARHPTVPGYEIVDELGSGGGGRVYKALQLGAGRRVVALKVLHQGSRGERERLARETRSLGRLSHPNIVTVYEVGDTPDGPFFTMEYLAGGSLARRIQNRPPTPTELAAIVATVARAVAAAHAAGILHRDLKPSNVLLAADGTPKVADFGLAKFVDGPTDATTMEQLTPANVILGTPAYMSPEQAAGRADELDERTDVYGLGAVLYHGLTGRTPFSGKTPYETAHRVLSDRLPLPRDVRRTVPTGLEAIAVRCLAKAKADRYASATDVADDLDRWLRSEPPVAPPVGLWRRWGHRVRQPAQWAAGVVAIALLVAAGAMALHRRDRREPQPEPPDELAQIEKELAAGEEVELIRDDGTARYTRWLSEAVAPSTPAYHDTAFSVVAARCSRVELLPAALVPKAFRLTATIRHDGTADDNSAVGVYFACHEVYPGDGSRFEYGLACQMSDFPPGPGSVLPPSVKSRLLLTAWHQGTSTGGRSDFWSAPVAGVAMPAPGFDQPREWRTVVIDCREAGVDYAWLAGERRVGPTNGPVKAETIRKSLELERRPVAAGLRNAGDDPDGWAGGGIGVLAVRGQVSVRRLSVVRLAEGQ